MYKFSYVFLCFAFLAQICNLTFLLVNCQQDEDDWKEPHYQIYGVEGPKLSYDEVIERLVKLSKIYQTKTDEQSLGRKKNVLDLLWMSQTSPLKCTDEDLNKFNRLQSFNSPCKVNVFPFTKHFTQKQREFCENPENYVTIVKELAGTVNIETLKEVDDLINNSQDSEGNKIELPLVRDVDLYVEAILHYMTKNSDNLEKHANSIGQKAGEKFQAEYETLVRDVCQELGDKFNYVGIRIIKKSPDILANDEFVKNWVRRGIICENIINDERLPKMVRKKLGKEKGNVMTKMFRSLDYDRHKKKHY